MKGFKKGFALIAALAFLIVAMLPVSGLAQAQSPQDAYAAAEAAGMTLKLDPIGGTERAFSGSPELNKAITITGSGNNLIDQDPSNLSDTGHYVVYATGDNASEAPLLTQETSPFNLVDGVTIAVTDGTNFTMEIGPNILDKAGSFTYQIGYWFAGQTSVTDAFPLDTLRLTVTEPTETPSYSINVSTLPIVSEENPEGGGEAKADPGRVSAGEVFTVSAAPNAGWTVSTIAATTAGTAIPQNEDGSFTAPAALSAPIDVVVTFVKVEAGQYTIAIDQNITGGVVSTEPAYAAAAGTTVTVNIAANDGYTLLSGPTVTQGTTNIPVANGQFTMPAGNVVVTATFEESEPVPPGTHAINVTQATGGTVTASASSATAGATFTVTATPNAGYELDKITVTNASTGAEIAPNADGSYTMPDAEVNVTASFTATAPQGPFDIVVDSQIENWLQADEVEANAGAVITLTVDWAAAELADSVPSGVTVRTDAGVGVPVTRAAHGNSYTFTMPAAAVTVTGSTVAKPTAPIPITNTIPDFVNAPTSADYDQPVTITWNPADYPDGIEVVGADGTIIAYGTSGSLTFNMPATSPTIRPITTTPVGNPISFIPGANQGTEILAGGPGRLIRAIVKDASGNDVLASGRWSVPTGATYTLAQLGVTDPSANPITITPNAALAAGPYSLVFTTADGQSNTFNFNVTKGATPFQVTEMQINEYGNGTPADPVASQFEEGSYVTVLQNGTSWNPSLRVIVQGPAGTNVNNTKFFWSANSDQLTLDHMRAEYLSPSATIHPDGVNVADGTITFNPASGIIGADGKMEITYQLSKADVEHIEAYTSGAVAAPRARTLPYLFFKALVVPERTGATDAEEAGAAIASSDFRSAWTTQPGMTLRTTDLRSLYNPGQTVTIEGLWAPRPAAVGTTLEQQPVWTLESTTAKAGSFIKIGGVSVQLSGTYPQTLNVNAAGQQGVPGNPFALTLTDLPDGTYTFGLAARATAASSVSASNIQIHVTTIQTGTGSWAVQGSADATSGKLPAYDTTPGAANTGWTQTNTIAVPTNGRFTIYVPVTDNLGNHVTSRNVAKTWEYRTSAAEGGANGITIQSGNGFYGVNAEQLRSGPVTADMNGWQFRLVATATNDDNYKAVSPWYTIQVTDAGAIAEVPDVVVTSAPESIAGVVNATQTADVTFTATVQNSIAANNLTYQWQSRAAATAQAPNPQWTNIAEATQKTYTVSNIAAALEGTQYRCIVTNNAFSTGINGDSNVLTMKVNTQAGAIIISSPTAASLRNLYSSRTADFAVTARTDNGDPVSYQWFVKGVPGPVVGGNIVTTVDAAAYLANAPVTAVSGATAQSYTTDALEEGVYEYVCRVTNQNNSALTQDSTGFYLVVTKLSRQPQITSPAPNTTEQVGIPAGKAITFKCDAHVQSQEALTYQWQASQNGVTGWADLPNQTAASFTLPNPAGENSGWYYRCVVTNAAANESATSGSYQLTVWNTADVPVVGAINPQSWEGSLDQANEAGVTLTSTAAAPSGAALTAVWKHNGTPVTNQPGQTYNNSTRQWESKYELPTDETGTNGNDIYSPSQAQKVNGQYSCEWTNGSAAINGGVSGTGIAPVTETGACTVNIIVPGAPRITAQPSSATTPVGSTATFSVGAILNPDTAAAVQGTLVYVWQMSEDGGETWRNVRSTDGTGQFTYSLSVPVTETMYDNETAANILGKQHVYQYRVNVANRASGLNFYSDEVTLTVTPGTASEPVITPKPDSPIKIEGEGADKVATGVTGTKDGITVKDYLDMLGYTAPAGYALRIVNTDGEQIADDAIVCTGYKLELVKESDNTVVDSATIIITGDVLGTGQINIAQLVRMARDLNDLEALTGVYLQAGDFNGTGNIDISDLVAEARIINETIDIMK